MKTILVGMEKLRGIRCDTCGKVKPVNQMKYIHLCLACYEKDKGNLLTFSLSNFIPLLNRERVG